MEINVITSNIVKSKFLKHIEVSLKDEFSERKCMLVVIDLTNTEGSATIPDYLILIQNKIAKGNSYIVNRSYLNSVLFGLKTISIEDTVLRQIDCFEEQIEKDLITYRELCRYVLDPNKDLVDVLPVVYLNTERIEGYCSKYIAHTDDSIETIIEKALSQCAKTRGKSSYDLFKTSITNLTDKVESAYHYSENMHQPLSIGRVPYIQTHKLNFEIIKREIEAFVESRNYVCIIDYISDQPVIYQLSSKDGESQITSKFGFSFNVISGVWNFYASPFYNSLKTQSLDLCTKKCELEHVLSNCNEQNTRYRLKIAGEINGRDIIALREYSQKLLKNGSFLECLNLSNCKIVSSEESYYQTETKWATCDCYTVNNILTKFLFFNFYVRHITTPSDIEKIDKYAFYNMPTLESLHLDAQKIERESITKCRCLKEISFSPQLSRISTGSIYECPSIETISLKDSKKYQIKYGGLYSNNKFILKIGDDSTEFNVPDDIAEIGTSAFYGKKNLKYVKFNSNLKKIGDLAFYGSGLLEFHIPPNVEHLGSHFVSSEIKDLYVYSAIPCPVPLGTFDCYNNIILHVPNGYVDSYKNARGWKYFEQIVEESYPPERYNDYINHVTSYAKAKIIKDSIKETSIIEINDINDSISFADFNGCFRLFILKHKRHFLLLLRYWKLVLLNDVIGQIENLHIFNSRGLIYIKTINSRIINYYIQEKCIDDLFYEEPDYQEMERDTFYALGGYDYDAFKEKGGNVDDMMDRKWGSDLSTRLKE